MPAAELSPDELRRIYEDSATIAVVGASAHEGKHSNEVPQYLQDVGYTIIPVNPRGGEMFGQHVYASLGDIQDPIDIVDVFRPPEEAEDVARAAIASGAKVLWFQPGTHSDEAAEVAADAGMIVVVDRCIRGTHRELEIGVRE
jgi:uncharacterized protein